MMHRLESGVHTITPFESGGVNVLSDETIYSRVKTMVLDACVY
jgi:hypothetical protein